MGELGGIGAEGSEFRDNLSCVLGTVTPGIGAGRKGEGSSDH